MSEAKLVTISSVEVTGPHTKKDGKGKYMRHNVTTTEGENFSLFGSTTSENPVVGGEEISGLVSGSQAYIIFERNGKFVNVQKLSISETSNSSSNSSSSSEKPVVMKNVKNGTKTSVSSIATSSVSSSSGNSMTSSPTLKDVSMELSGLLQAFISTGHYQELREVTLDNGNKVMNVYVKDTLLKLHMQRILAVKDELALERSSK